MEIGFVRVIHIVAISQMIQICPRFHFENKLQQQIMGIFQERDIWLVSQILRQILSCEIKKCSIKTKFLSFSTITLKNWFLLKEQFHNLPEKETFFGDDPRFPQNVNLLGPLFCTVIAFR